MKNILLCLCGFIFSISIYAQCDAPIVESWTAPSVDNITVNFTAPDDAQSYILEITGEYGYNWDSNNNTFDFNESLILTGSISSDFTNVNFDATGIVSPDSLLNRYYYSAFLSVVCAGGDTSAINRFYISEFSLLNDPEYNTGDFFVKPMELMVYGMDDTGEVAESYITIPPGDTQEGIDSISVFVDFAKPENYGFTIQLISPQGTTVSLLFPAYQLGTYTRGFSVIFKDGYPIIANTGSAAGPRGIYAPTNSLSALEGENPEGVWTLRVTNQIDVFDGMLCGFGLNIFSSPCVSTLSGTAYYDLNANNIQDAGEFGLANAVIENSIDNQDFIASETGNFTDCTSAGSGSLSMSNIPNYYSVDDISFTISEGEMLTDLDFPIQPMPGFNDLKVDLFTMGVDRPGFDNSYVVHYENVGTECIDNIDLQVTLDNLLLITGTSNNSASFSGNTAQLNINELCPMDNGYFIVYTFLDESVSLFTELVSIATISPVANDQNTSDNVSEYYSTVVGSYDPNDKMVSTNTISPEFISSGDPLKYTVRFQNTGTYLAERVVVIDTLDQNLDLNSFVLTLASHDVEVTRNGNVVYFDFENIFLPDSNTSETDSHGFIRYEIKPTAGLINGETIENKAYIFFDFNAPIITNTATTLVDFSSGISENDLEAKVFPNPAKAQIGIEWLPDVQVQQVNLLDLNGKKINSYNVSGKDQVKINLDKLPAGAYIFQFIGPDNIKPIVWMKE